MRGASQYCGRPNATNITLQAAAAQTATGNGSAVDGLGEFEQATWQLELTAAATDVGDTLDVFIQTTVDGTTWLDIVHFTQMLGNGGAKRYIAKTNAAQPLTMIETGTALAAAAVRNLFGDQYRVRWAITDADADCSFTFSVKANFQ